MNIVPELAATAGMTMLSSARAVSRVLGACVLTLGLAVVAQAAPITGDPVSNTFGWTPNSTNALNYAQQVPGRVGQAAPYVLFNSNAVGSVTLDFFNPGPGLAFFEARIDGVETGASNHPVVIGDMIKAGNNTSVNTLTNVLGKEFFAASFVDIRLALGAERDWDFDWVRFEVLQANNVPEPGSLGLLALGLVSVAAMRRRRAG